MNQQLRDFVIQSNAIEQYFLEGVDFGDWSEGTVLPWSHPIFEQHYRILELAVESAKDLVALEPNLIHTHLMYGLLPPQLTGQVRSYNVAVGGWVCPEPYMAASLLSKWMVASERYTKEVGKDCSNCDVGKAWWLHNAFEYIHPYADGNGRTGRILLACHLVMTGRPVEPVMYTDRFAYYQKLRLFTRKWDSPTHFAEMMDNLAPVAERQTRMA